MAILHIDTLTAEVALRGLAERGHDLTTFAQAIDEDWKRFAPDPASGSRHLISTMGNRQDCPPTGLPYYNAQLIQPGPVDAERRPIGERFLRGGPLLCAEVTRDGAEYRLATALIKIDMSVWIVIDREAGRTTFHVAGVDLPDTALAAATGRRLGDIAALGHMEDEIVLGARAIDAKEMRKVAAKAVDGGIAVDVAPPGWTAVAFDRIYAGGRQ